ELAFEIAVDHNQTQKTIAHVGVTERLVADAHQLQWVHTGQRHPAFMRRWRRSVRGSRSNSWAAVGIRFLLLGLGLIASIVRTGITDRIRSFRRIRRAYLLRPIAR